MQPVEENVSAFAVYSGKASLSKKQKKRLKLKERKSLEQNLTKQEKIDIIKTKKLKKEKILLSKANGSTHVVESIHANNSLINSVKSLDIPNNKSFTIKTKKKKVKKDVLQALNDIPINKPKKNKSNKKKQFYDIEYPNMGSANVKSNENVTNGLIPCIKNISSDTVVTNEEYNGINESVLVMDTLKPSKKARKNVSIKSPEPRAEVPGTNRKPIICTPRYEKKQKKIVRDFSKKRKLVDLSPTKTLKEVDKYLLEKKDIESKLAMVSSSSKGQKDIELAHQAKTETLTKSSEVMGKYSLEKILEPVSVDSFIREHWEKAPAHIPGNNPKRFSQLISTERIDAVLRDRIVQFGKHLDVTTYANGQRETHNLEGRANAHVVWDFYSNGCSVRLLNPQYFFHSVHALNAVLQEYFGCFVGANAYLTPPMSQGFAPHYDDIEAFILQIEGSKIWRVYQPMDKDGYLPRYSSRNLTDEEVGEPVLEVKLNPGDVLYFPRGYIHQGRTEKEHSLHLTLSVYQKTAWCDLLEKLLPLSLKKAAKNDIEFRKGLPIGYLKSAGLVHKNSPSRKEIVGKIKKLVTRLVDFLETDAAIDQMGLSFVQDALPPVLSVSEAACSVAGDGWKMRANGKLQNQIIISPDTEIRWIRAYCYRIVEEEVVEENTIEKQVRIYHTLENSKEYHAEEPQFLVADYNMLPALRHLTSTYPAFTKVSDLPSGETDEKIQFVSDLWDRGLLMTSDPLQELKYLKTPNEGNEFLTNVELAIVADLEEKIPKDIDADSSSESENIEVDVNSEMDETENELVSGEGNFLSTGEEDKESSSEDDDY